jgi:hypothetical protein
MKRLNFLLIVSVTLLTLWMPGCLNPDDNDTGNKDWAETVFLTVASEFVDYYIFDGELRPIPGGLNIKEDKNSYWSQVPQGEIEGFTYEVGYEYRLKVLKTHLANPPADGSDIRYKLIEVISKTWKSEQ